MSFSGTPLGQGRRLDHQTFLHGGHPAYNQPQTTTSPGRVPSISSIPLSYAYGAPTLGNRSPGKQISPSTSHRPVSPTRSNISLHRQSGVDDLEDDEEDEAAALARYARIKQRNELLSNRPGYTVGPGIITSPPKPTGADLKDTSVNIASAFFQAASSYAAMSGGSNANSSWGSSSRANLPRSTSVEYEKETQSTSHRRLAVPPNRMGSRGTHSKPPSKSASVRQVSDAENDRSGESVDANGRGKSPFDHLADFTKRAMAPATFLMRQRSHEPEDVYPPSRQTTEATLVGGNNNSASYDYAEEEAEYQRSIKPSSKRTAAAAAHKRNRMSMDNRAYRPPVSDLDDDSDEDVDEDGRKSRKKKSKKKDLSGGPLTTLPVAGYDKRKKKKGRSSKDNGQDVADEDGSISDELASLDHRSVRSTTPTQRHGSVARGSIPPPSRASIPPPEPLSYEYSGPTDTSLDIEQGLDPISEAEEYGLEPPPDIDTSRESAHHAYPDATQPRRRSVFSIGVLLGTLVNWIYRLGHGIVLFVLKLLAMITLLFGRILGGVFNVLVRQPVRFARHAGRVPFVHLGKYVVVMMGMWLAWYGLRHPTIANLSTGFPLRSGYGYQAPNMPPGDVDELSARLLMLENALADLRSETHGTHSRLESDERKHRDVIGRVSQLETRVEKDVVSALQADRLATSQNIDGLQKEVRNLQQEVSSKSSEGSGSDEEARAKLNALEERMEGGLKEALELARAAAKAGGAVAASSPAWWNKLSTGSGSSLTIKSSDGQDVTSLIRHLVDTALSRQAKDDLAIVDYALYSGGAQVIPHLTSPTYAIKPPSKRAYLLGLITGDSFSMGRPPVTALHHELHLGNCWPFDGPQGQLGVSLAAPVYISAVTIDHVTKEVAHDMRSAPREMELWGYVDGQDNLAKFREYQAQRQQAKEEAAESGLPVPGDEVPRALGISDRHIRIASFTYDVHAPNNIQTFAVPEEIQDLGIDFSLVILVIKSNWGSTFTCLYRMRVHGTRLEPVPFPELESPL